MTTRYPLSRLCIPVLLTLVVAIACGSDKSVYDLEVGDCIVPPETEAGETIEVGRVKKVDCSAPHDGEVTAVFDVELDEYPGDTALFDMVIERCPERSSTAIYPTEETWGNGDREAVCILESLFDLSVGDCIVYPDAEEVTGIRRADCSETHDGEVIDLLEMADGDYPGDDGIAEYADANCPEEAEFHFTPTEESGPLWAPGAGR